MDNKILKHCKECGVIMMQAEHEDGFCSVGCREMYEYLKERLAREAEQNGTH